MSKSNFLAFASPASLAGEELRCSGVDEKRISALESAQSFLLPLRRFRKHVPASTESRSRSIPGGQPAVAALSEQIAAILRCLTCQGRVEPQADGVVCTGCGRKYPLVNGVIRFVDEQQYAGSFGFQWQVH